VGLIAGLDTEARGKIHCLCRGTKDEKRDQIYFEKTKGQGKFFVKTVTILMTGKS
jgi:hypothetical protein